MLLCGRNLGCRVNLTGGSCVDLLLTAGAARVTISGGLIKASRCWREAQEAWVPGETER